MSKHQLHSSSAILFIAQTYLRYHIGLLGNRPRLSQFLHKFTPPYQCITILKWKMPYLYTLQCTSTTIAYSLTNA
jgi:hypothetical protein